MYIKEDGKNYRLATVKEISDSLVEKLKSTFDRSPLLCEEDVANYLRAKYSLETQEFFGCIMLDLGLKVICVTELAKGSLKECAVLPRQVVKAALDVNASAVMLFHNHPGANPMPSQSDINFTNKTKAALKLFEIALHEHMIVAGPTVVSLRTMGLLDD